MSRFCKVLRDEDRGRSYRQFAGITADNIPCEATFSNFRGRIGASHYNEIFHVLVDTFHQLEMITFKVLAHDGTIYPTPGLDIKAVPISAISVPASQLKMSLAR